MLLVMDSRISSKLFCNEVQLVPPFFWSSVAVGGNVNQTILNYIFTRLKIELIEIFERKYVHFKT